jgi:hypothetical protein
MSSLAGAVMYNPTTTYYGTGPIFGIYLDIDHPLSFYLILGMLCGFHLAFVILVTVLTNKTKLGPKTHLKMGAFLRPLTDTLEQEQVKSDKENNGETKRLESVMTVLYEKDATNVGKWGLRIANGGRHNKGAESDIER